MIKRDDTRTPPPDTVIPKNFKPAFLRYLDVVAGNLIAQGGFGEIRISFEAGKPIYTWYTVGHKEGHQF